MRNKAIIAAIAFQLLIVGGIFVKAMYPLVVGREIALEVQGRDPVDLFRGHYVALNYEYSWFVLSKFPHNLDTNTTYTYGDKLYLQLKKKGKSYRPVGLWTDLRETDDILLCVTPEYRFTPRYPGDTTSVESHQEDYPQRIGLVAGIEEYFASPEKAKEIEKAVNEIRRQNRERQRESDAEEFSDNSSAEENFGIEPDEDVAELMKIYVKVMVAPNGQARIKGIIYPKTQKISKSSTEN